MLLFGPNGTGKGTRFLIPNLLSIKDRSIIVIDPKGELAAVTADYRRTVGDVVMLNPFNVLGLGSAGFNPLTALDPKSANFYDTAWESSPAPFPRSPDRRPLAARGNDGGLVAEGPGELDRSKLLHAISGLPVGRDGVVEPDKLSPDGDLAVQRCHRHRQSPQVRKGYALYPRPPREPQQLLAPAGRGQPRCKVLRHQRRRLHDPDGRRLLGGHEGWSRLGN